MKKGKNNNRNDDRINNCERSTWGSTELSKVLWGGECGTDGYFFAKVS
jgi:hypothetical protein